MTTSPSVRVKEVSAVMPSKMSVKEVITSSLAGLTNFLINFHFHLGRVDYLYSDTFRENTHRSQKSKHIQRQFANPKLEACKTI